MNRDIIHHLPVITFWLKILLKSDADEAASLMTPVLDYESVLFFKQSGSVTYYVSSCTLSLRRNEA
jgi:hypothetical protein